MVLRDVKSVWLTVAVSFVPAPGLTRERAWSYVHDVVSFRLDISLRLVWALCQSCLEYTDALERLVISSGKNSWDARLINQRMVDALLRWVILANNARLSARSFSSLIVNILAIGRWKRTEKEQLEIYTPWAILRLKRFLGAAIQLNAMQYAGLWLFHMLTLYYIFLGKRKGRLPSFLYSIWHYFNPHVM